MTKTEVLALLKVNKDERGIKNWKRLGEKSGGLKSYGIGLTKLRKLGKEIGKDHDLALKLWNSDVYDAKVIALVIDDPKKITREQAETQVEQLGKCGLTHVFSSCGAALAKTPFTVELADNWIQSKDKVRNCCGYGLLYEVSKITTKKAPEEKYFLDHIKRIKESWKDQSTSVLMSMAGALMGIGKRSKKLNAAALKVVRKIGPIKFDGPDGNCDPFDAEKHLTSDYIKKKLGI